MRSLPRAKASPAFASDVLRAVRDRQSGLSGQARSPVFHVWRLAAGVAMAACLVAVVHLASMQYLHTRNVAQLRAEQQQLEAELEAVKKIASRPEPAVVFENDKGTRVIVDVDSAVQPASYRFD